MGYSYSGYYGSLPCCRHGFDSRISLSTRRTRLALELVEESQGISAGANPVIDIEPTEGATAFEPHWGDEMQPHDSYPVSGSPDG